VDVLGFGRVLQVVTGFVGIGVNDDVVKVHGGSPC
jgi:hypothetical protein